MLPQQGRRLTLNNDCVTGDKRKAMKLEWYAWWSGSQRHGGRSVIPHCCLQVSRHVESQYNDLDVAMRPMLGAHTASKVCKASLRLSVCQIMGKTAADLQNRVTRLGTGYWQ